MRSTITVIEAKHPMAFIPLVHFIPYDMIRRILQEKRWGGLASDGRLSAVRQIVLAVLLVAIATYCALFRSFHHSLMMSLVPDQYVTALLPTLSTTTTTTSSTVLLVTNEEDADCIFRDSKIYRKVFVYPSPNEPEWTEEATKAIEKSLLTNHGRTTMMWPWLDIDAKARAAEQGHYNINSQNVQYTSELLIREIMVNPQSCLRTYDPEQAELFYVPYLPSTEHHLGDDRKLDYSFSPFGKAILEILDNQNYEPWETTFGLTAKYWKRRGGSDHILVFSEPMHGLFHPRSKRGHYHFIHSQKQLTPPIVFSVELSTSFVQQYPKCARKNILLPYPNTNGGWFNQEATTTTTHRTISQYYAAGNHGTCTQLRQAMQNDYRSCSPSYRLLQEQNAMPNAIGMRKSIFCPCPVRQSSRSVGRKRINWLVGFCSSHNVSRYYTTYRGEIHRQRNECLIV